MTEKKKFLATLDFETSYFLDFKPKNVLSISHDDGDGLDSDSDDDGEMI